MKVLVLLACVVALCAATSNVNSNGLDMTGLTPMASKAKASGSATIKDPVMLQKHVSAAKASSAPVDPKQLAAEKAAADESRFAQSSPTTVISDDAGAPKAAAADPLLVNGRPVVDWEAEEAAGAQAEEAENEAIKEATYKAVSDNLAEQQAENNQASLMQQASQAQVVAQQAAQNEAEATQLSQEAAKLASEKAQVDAQLQAANAAAKTAQTELSATENQVAALKAQADQAVSANTRFASQQAGEAGFLGSALSAVGNVAKKVGGAALKVGGAALGAAAGAAGAMANGGLSMMASSMMRPMMRAPQDIEDCVACRYVWLQTEMDVGNSQMEAAIMDAFTKNCVEAQKAPIFYPACQDMYDSADTMVADYMKGYTVNQMCENSRICR